MPIKSNLKALLDERGIKYGWLAKQIRVRNATMTNLINGGSPQLETALKIARELGVPVERIWTVEDDKT